MHTPGVPPRPQRGAGRAATPVLRRPQLRSRPPQATRPLRAQDQTPYR
ncbi:UNVERIFIED_CONTAM: hypothetical protein GTU68_064172, partial [Idotea baltica]|nr:hypothetical protein [Idotea baltica]